MDQGDKRGVFDHTEAAPPQVKDPEAHKFGEEQKIVRHRWPKSITESECAGRGPTLREHTISI
jgi:hypothetical protein